MMLPHFALQAFDQVVLDCLPNGFGRIVPGPMGGTIRFVGIERVERDQRAEV